MKKFIAASILPIGALLAFAAPAQADLNLNDVQLVAPNGEEAVAAQVLKEEIVKRTGLDWTIVKRPGEQSAIKFISPSLDQ